MICLKTDESPIGGELQEDITEKNTITSSSFNDESKTEDQRNLAYRRHLENLKARDDEKQQETKKITDEAEKENRKADT